MTNWAKLERSPDQSNLDDLSMLQAFQLLDTDDSDRVSPAGIKRVLCGDDGTDPKVVDRLISEVGKDESGRVAFSEFRELMNKILNESQELNQSPDGKTKADQLAQYVAICRELND